MSESEQILTALRRITRAIDLLSRQLMRDSGLNVPQLVVLQALSRNGPMPASALARAVSLSQATIISILDRLERSGHALRERSTTDKRIAHVSLTETGRAAIDAAPDLLQPAFIREFAKLESWERMMISALQRIAELMDAEHLDAWPILAVGEFEEAAGDGDTPPSPRPQAAWAITPIALTKVLAASARASSPPAANTCPRTATATCARTSASPAISARSATPSPKAATGLPASSAPLMSARMTSLSAMRVT
jgi:DNA-binding MarR family transcriptional regulator